MISNIKLYKQSSIALIASISRMVLAFISVPILLNYLGVERYGLWAIATSFITFINLLDAGITPTLKNKLSNAYALKKMDNHIFYFKTGLFFGLVLFLLLLLSIIPIYLTDWQSVFNIKGNLAISESKYLMIVVSFISLSTLIFANIENYYASKLQLSKVKLWDAIANVFTLVILFVLIKFRPSLPLLALVYSSPQIIVRIGLLIAIFFKKPDILKIKAKDLNKYRSELYSDLKIGSHFLGVQVCESILAILPGFILLHAINLEAVSYYSVTYKIMSLPLLCIASVLPVVWPSFTIAWAKGEFLWIRNKLNKFMITTSIGFLLFLLIMLFAGNQLILIWSKGSVNANNYMIFFCWLISVILALTYWLSTFLHSIGDFKFEFYSHVLITVSMIIMGYFGAKYYGLLTLLFSVSFCWFMFGLLPMKLRVKKIINSNLKL